MDRKDIYEFLKSNDHCVLSTSSDDRPQSALMGFGISEDLDFIFGTSNKSRKYNNIQNNSNVSIVVGFDQGKTVQCEGIAELLEGEELDKYKNIYFTLRPSVKKYESLPDQVYFKVKLNWLRYTDVTKQPWDVTEINF